MTVLGRKVSYKNSYDPKLLFAILRADNRQELNISQELPFSGCDFWNAYEVSWLNKAGKPAIAIAEIQVPCDSPKLIESKSLKLYLNSLNNEKFTDMLTVEKIITQDLSDYLESEILVKLIAPKQFASISRNNFSGACIDDLDIECVDYSVNSSLLTTTDTIITEKVYSNLLKSNCKITGQPDWASIQISYKGREIKHENLLRYIVSYRNHNEFHEHCVERIFTDIMQQCQPELLTIQACFTRRGGIDINPCRSNDKNVSFVNVRLSRQ